MNSIQNKNYKYNYNYIIYKNEVLPNKSIWL